MWTLILILSTGHLVQVNYPTQQACELKRQEYIVQRDQTASWLNEHGFTLGLDRLNKFEQRNNIARTSESDYYRIWYMTNKTAPSSDKEVLNAKYPKARVDLTYTINKVDCLSF